MAMTARATIKAWNPPVPGVSEVFHAQFIDHAYPIHTHDSWDLMILDDGVVRFNLDRHDHGSAHRTRVILLPPGVPHDGRTVNAAGFRKRVVYLDATILPLSLVGAAVDTPIHDDGTLRDRLDDLHDCLAERGRELEAESRLWLIRERILRRLGADAMPNAQAAASSSRRVAQDLRELLDSSVETGLTLAGAARVLHSKPAHLVRSFSQTFGLPPHRYLTSRRIEQARRLLLAGVPIADAAAAAGFYDQAHLHRHFVRFLGVTPGSYARSHSIIATQQHHPTERR